MERIKRENILLGGLVLVVVIAAFYIYKINKKEAQIPVVENQQQVTRNPVTKEDEIQKQLRELEELRGSDQKKFTDEEIEQQLKELEELRKDQKPLTQQEIDEQLKQLEQLRQENK